jgi:hypothetical protein
VLLYSFFRFLKEKHFSEKNILAILGKRIEKSVVFLTNRIACRMLKMSDEVAWQDNYFYR